MYQRNILAGIVLAASLFYSFSASALGNSSPIGIGLFPPLQIPSSDYGINGIRLGVVGMNRSMAGLDIGLLGNTTDQSFTGAAVSLLFNYNKIAADIVGFQVAGLANINGTGSSLYGVQLGLYNKVTNVYGLQLGLINVTSNLHGIQIGLINFNDAGPFKISPLINASF
jgi:hypothetical protein